MTGGRPGRDAGRAAGHDERGSSSVEAAIVVPVLLLFVAVVIGGARIAMAQQSVALAAQATARAASLERTVGEAVPAGRAAARTALTTSSVDCTPEVTVTGNWSLPIGVAGTASATVSCRVPLSDLMLPGLPGTIVITRSADSPIDPYRARNGP